MAKFMYVITILCSLAAVLITAAGVFTSEQSAIQQAALFALALCVAVIPYIIARSIQELGRKD